MSQIFISHAGADKAIAAWLAASLKHHGYTSLFLDLDPQDGIHAGQVWKQELYRRLGTCSAVVAINSAQLGRSNWCFAEIAYGGIEGKPVFPVIVDDSPSVSISAELPTGLVGNQRVSAALSDDGRLFATGQFTGAIALWDLAELERPVQIASWRNIGEVAAVTALAFSPDRTLLASGGFRANQLWDITDQTLPRPIGRHLVNNDLPLTVALAFTSDGRALVTNHAHKLRVWDVSKLGSGRKDVQPLACKLLNGHGLSRQEWVRVATGVPFEETCR